MFNQISVLIHFNFCNTHAAQFATSYFEIFIKLSPLANHGGDDDVEHKTELLSTQLESCCSISYRIHI